MNRKLIVLAALTVLATSCKMDIPVLHQRKEIASVKVSVLRIEPQSLSGKYTYVGEVASSRTAMVSSAHSGKVVSVNVRKGDMVKAGQVLAKVKSQTAESAFKIAQANLEQARDGYDRATKVYDGGGLSEVQYMDIKTKLAQAESAMESARKSLDDCSVKAPYAGVMNAVFVNEGEEIPVEYGIARVLDLSSMEIRISVHENEIGRIHNGDCASVEIPALGVSGLKATVVSRSVLSSALSHSYECILRLTGNPRGMLPGMSVKVRFDEPGESSIVVPATAVQVDRDGRYVWTCDDGIVHKRYVKVGGYAGRGVVVTEGLAIGDNVITAGYQKVSGGMKVVTE